MAIFLQMIENSDQMMDWKMVATSMGFKSSKSLYYKCKKVFGKTPKQIIEEHTYLRVKGFLKDTNMSIGEIEGKLGFENRFSFNNFVKKHGGSPPKSMRVLLRSNENKI